MSMNRWLRRAAACVGALLLATLDACGGGGAAASGGASGTGTAVSLGTVTGFGSVVIAGRAYDGAAPHYFDDDAPGVGQAASSIGLGQSLQLLQDASASAALIEPDVAGPLQSVSPTTDSFTVNGLQVRVNTDPAAGPVTFYSGLRGFSALQPGTMVIEADGAFGVDARGRGYLQATRVVQLPGATPSTRLTGMVSGLDAGATGFDLGSVHVRMTAATQVYPAGARLRDGELVNVWSPTRITGNLLDARVVRVRSLLGATGAARIGGLVAPGPAPGIRVAGIDVTPADPATAAALQALRVGEYVVVQGRVAPDGRSVLADSVQSSATQPAIVELRGNITDYVDAAHFLVRGVPVNAAAVAAGERLGNGVFVRITGSVDAAAPNTVRAASLQVLATAPDGGTLDLTGTVRQYDAASHTLLLSWSDDGQTTASVITVLQNAVISNGSASRLVDGAYVEVEASNSPDGLQAYSLRFLPGHANAAASSTSGRVYGLDGSSFYVNGLHIAIHGVRVTGGRLADGARVDVQFSADADSGELLARAIAIDN